MESVEGRVEITGEIETHLFDVMEHYPPLGINKWFNMLNMRTYIADERGIDIPAHQLKEWLKSYYNLTMLILLFTPKPKAEDDTMGLNVEPRDFFIPDDWKSVDGS